MVKAVDKLQVILKIAERCNLACTYCYYFYGGDDSYKSRPALISISVVKQLVDFINRSLKETSINTIDIALHGGEPLLLPKKKFDEMCSVLSQSINANIKLNFSIQTNATLIDEEWINIFEKHNINVGISIDGPKYYNDKYRIDHNGQGSYTKITNGINQLIEAKKIGKIHTLSSISVMNGNFDYGEVSRHLYNDLHLNRLSFLFPDINHDDDYPNNTKVDNYTKALIDIFNVWKCSTTLSVRELDIVFRFYQEQLPNNIDYSEYDRLEKISNQIIVIQSDGTLTVDDSFMPTKEWRKKAPSSHINNTTLNQFLSHDIFQEIFDAYNSLPDKCEACSWAKLCKGGDLENRYSTKTKFNNPSVFCESLSSFYLAITNHLIENGYPKEKILEKLRA